MKFTSIIVILKRMIWAFLGGPNRFETRKQFRPVLDVKSVQENHSPSNDDRPRK